jgi:hypothetical protein
MQKDFVNLKLDLKEAYLLFKLMGIESFVGYTNPFKYTNRLDLEHELIRAKNSLLLEGVLIERERRLAIEPSAFSILQACKLSQNISWLHIDKDNKIRDSYFYISSRQVIEVTEQIDKDTATIEFKLIGDHEDFFYETEQVLNVPVACRTERLSGKMNHESYIHLLNSYDKISFNELVSYLDTCEKMSRNLAESFIKSLLSSTAVGQMVFINKEQGVLNGVKFVLSEYYDWVLTLNNENDNELLLESVLPGEVLKKLFETYVNSYSKTKQ